MHPGMMYWWKRRHECGGGEDMHAGCGPGGPGFGGPFGHHPFGHGFPGFGGWQASDHDGGGFGVRRPLRFLAFKLALREEQVDELARVLNDLKTERAQAEVDSRRTLSAFADAVAAESFDATKAAEGAQLRVQSAERLREAVSKALGRIHAILDPEQRQRFAYLIRTGTVTL